VFFFEKKNQKTFVRLVPRKLTQAMSGGKSAGVKVFWFFFQKLTLLSVTRWRRARQQLAPAGGVAYGPGP
jgi:hypothetical protein